MPVINDVTLAEDGLTNQYPRREHHHTIERSNRLNIDINLVKGLQPMLRAG